MRFVLVIQTRAASTRLPGKAFLDLLPGKTLTECVVERALRAQRVQQVVLAFPRTNTSHDWHFKEIADTAGVVACCPVDMDENHLVARHIEAAALVGATHIVRVPGDNPCVDPAFIDAAVAEYLTGKHIFYTNTTAQVDGVWVDGIGAEVFSVSRLYQVAQLARGRADWQEHPHKWFYDTLPHVVPPPADLRVDVNTRSEFEFVKRFYDHFQSTRFTAQQLVAAHKEFTHV